MSDSKIPVQLKEAISGVMELLKSGDLPEFVAKLTFPNDSKPLAAWSSSNRMLCAFSYIFEKEKEAYEKADKKGRLKILMDVIDKIDFRGFNQWNEKGRYIKKGEKCYCYILAPSFKKFDEEYVTIDGKKRQVHNDSESKKKYYYSDDKKSDRKYIDTEKINKETIQYISGFRGIPVFEKDQTFGKELKYEKLEMPDMRYKEVADFLGITVKVEGFRGSYYGYYSQSKKEIVLATPDQTTFFHELSHAVDDHLLKAQGKSLKGGQQSDQEIVAQFSANVLAYMTGYKIPESTAYTKKYIEHYSSSKNPEEEILKLMSRIEKITDFITNFKTESPSRQQEKKEGEEPSDAEKLAKEESKSINEIRKNNILSKENEKFKDIKFVKKAIFIETHSSKRVQLEYKKLSKPKIDYVAYDSEGNIKSISKTLYMSLDIPIDEKRMEWSFEQLKNNALYERYKDKDFKSLNYLSNSEKREIELTKLFYEKKYNEMLELI